MFFLSASIKPDSVGKIAEKQSLGVYFLTTWHRILNAELTKKRTPSDCFLVILLTGEV